MDGHVVEHVVPAALLYHGRKLLSALGALTHDDARARLAVDYVPALALAQRAVLVLGGIGVVRVHLHGEVLARVQDLDEQREAVALGARKELVMALPELGEVLAVKLAAVDNTVAVRMGRDAPALANGAIWNHVAKALLELASAPDLPMEDGREKDEVPCHTSRSVCHMSHPFQGHDCRTHHTICGPQITPRPAMHMAVIRTSSG